jgi:hypothetical protein
MKRFSDRERLAKLEPEQRVAWMNEHEFRHHRWEVGMDVWCLVCSKSFKAESVAMDKDGLFECPHCQSGLHNFAPLPWWDDKLTEYAGVDKHGGTQYRWKGKR